MKLLDQMIVVYANPDALCLMQDHGVVVEDDPISAQVLWDVCADSTLKMTKQKIMLSNFMSN